MTQGTGLALHGNTGYFSKAQEKERSGEAFILGSYTITFWVALLPSQERQAALRDRLPPAASP